MDIYVIQRNLQFPSQVFEITNTTFFAWHIYYVIQWWKQPGDSISVHCVHKEPQKRVKTKHTTSMETVAWITKYEVVFMVILSV